MKDREEHDQLEVTAVTHGYSSLDTYTGILQYVAGTYAVAEEDIEDALARVMISHWQVDQVRIVGLYFPKDPKEGVSITCRFRCRPVTDTGKKKWLELIARNKVSPNQITEEVERILGKVPIYRAFKGHIVESVLTCHLSISSSPQWTFGTWCVDVGCRFGQYADHYCPFKVGMMKETQ